MSPTALEVQEADRLLGEATLRYREAVRIHQEAIFHTVKESGAKLYLFDYISRKEGKASTFYAKSGPENDYLGLFFDLGAILTLFGEDAFLNTETLRFQKAPPLFYELGYVHF